MTRKKVLIISVMMAVIAVALIHLYTSSIKEKYAGEQNLVKVVVAKTQIPAETVVTKDMLAQRSYHKDFVPKGAILLTDLSRIIGMRVTVNVEAKEPLLTAHFEEGAAAAISRLGLSDLVLAGERAVTIQVDEQTGVAGLLRPGDHVDVLGTFLKADEKTGNTTLTTTTVIQNLPIIAVGGVVGSGETRGGGARGYRSVTLSVTLQEAELLIFAQQKSRLTLILRNTEDSEALDDVPEINFGNLFDKGIRKEIQERRNKINRSRIEIIQ